MAGGRPPAALAVLHPSLHADRTPDKAAIVMADSSLRISYAALEARSNQAAQLFRALGLKQGDHVALLIENEPAFLEICVGAHRAGLYYTAISTRLTAAEVAYIVDDCDAQVLIASGALAQVAAAAHELTPRLKHCFVLDGAAGQESFEAAVDAQPATRIADEIAGADMLYSSGTTGRPKGIRRRIGAPLGSPYPLLNLVQQLYGMRGDGIYLSPGPLYHSAPLRYAMAQLNLGGTVIVMPSFDAETALKLIERHGVTHSQWVPTMFIRLLRLPPEVRARHDLGTHETAIHGAAPCPAEVKRQMIDWWGPILYEYYAGTEGNGWCAISSPEWLAHPGSVGRAAMGEVHILDEDGNELPQGETGTVYFGGGPAFEYHKDPAKTAESRNARGWSTLGDVGHLDPDGYLHLTDRRAYMIISGGVNIYPQEAENLLAAHPEVVDVAVFGVPNAEFGEEVKAVVQPVDMAQAGPELERRLISYCRERLSPIKCPRSVDFAAELPRHATGKLYKRLLRDRYWGKRGGFI